MDECFHGVGAWDECLERERVNKVIFFWCNSLPAPYWKDNITMTSQKIAKYDGIIYRICNNFDIK